MDKWTPGPWRINRDARVLIQSNITGEDVCTVYEAGGKWRGNLQLIKAAPEMAELLNTWLVEYVEGSDPILDDLMQPTRALLARIEGESE